MLYPRESETREIKDLCGFWNFRCDFENVGRSQNWQDALLSDAMTMPVPASFNDLTQNPRIRDHIGDVWYQRDVFIPASWKGRRIVLRVGAAAHRSVVWLDGEKIGENKGGFLPFEFDITGRVRCGRGYRLTIVVNNILDGETLPPGWIKSADDPNYPDGYKWQDYEFDFFNYAGIHRPVMLYATEATYIDDITVVTDIDGAAGIVNYEVSLSGGDAPVKVRLLDAAGREVASADGASGQLRVSDATLWAPGAAYLYTLEARAGEADVYRLPVGIRTVEIRDGKFLINGQEFYFRGFGKHEDMDVKGRALDLAMVRKDFSLLNWIGANSFRTSHYPYAEEILEMADREGIVVIDEAPAVGMYIFKGKQDAFNEEALGKLLPHHVDVMQRLIARDKNHPCVVMWSVSNEAATQEKTFEPYMKEVFGTTRASDPQKRPVTVVVHTWFDNDVAVPMADVICLNRYWGWYGQTGQLDLIEAKGEWELRQWFEHQRKPMILSEYGADTLAGLHKDPPTVFSEEYQIAMVKRINNVLDRLDFIIGEHLWNFADFMTKQGITRVDGNKKGVFTRQRQPKSIAHMLRKRWTGKDLFGDD